MKYENMVEGRFINRPNRFIANVEINNKIEVCHVKNTGRCRELLIPGKSIVYVQHNNNPNRKTKYSLITVKKGDRLINMDSQVPNKVVYEFIKSGKMFEGASLIKPEKTYKNSRFDLYVEQGDKKIFIEVKGVTLEEDGVVRFPDAPSVRAVKHVNELCECIKEGYEAYIVFVIQMKDVLYFEPNVKTQKEFAEVLKKAKKRGVNILAFDCNIKEDSIEICSEVEVRV